MPRFPPIPADALDDDQRRMAARAAPTGPYHGFLRAPLLWEHLQPLRHYFADQSLLAPDEREAAILVLAHRLDSPAFAAHRPLALAAGIAAEAIDALASGIDPAACGLAPGAALAGEVVDRLLRDHRLDDELFARAARRWGERGIVELICLTGFFATIALMLNVAQDDVPPTTPPGAAAYSPADKS